MGIDHANLFLRKVKEDPALREKFTQMRQEHMQRLQEELVTTGSQLGLEFTSEELNEAAKQYLNNQTDADITEEELDAVEGGMDDTHVSPTTLLI